MVINIDLDTHRFARSIAALRATDDRYVSKLMSCSRRQRDVRSAVNIEDWGNLGLRYSLRATDDRTDITANFLAISHIFSLFPNEPNFIRIHWHW